MDRKKVIIASPHVWDSPYKVGSHQYAKCFAEDGWDVAYLSTHISPFHIAYHILSASRAKVLLPQRLSSWLRGGRQVEGIWTYVPLGFLPIANHVLFRSQWAIDNAWRFFLPPLQKKLQEKGFASVDTIWIDSPVFGFLLDMLPHRKSVLRIADDLSGFPELGRNIIEGERRLIKRADLVVATTNDLVRKAAGLGAKKSLFLPNGVDFDHFASKKYTEPDDLAAIPSPRVVYLGAIERWFNEEWLSYAASRLVDASFVVIGPYTKGSLPVLEKMRNVFLLGKRDYLDVPAYLTHSHVGMIPFRKLPFIESVNPIKLYEYMACGLPVVSTKWKSLEEASSPALLADTREEFARFIKEALGARPEQKSGFVQFAEKNRWARRFELVKEYLA